ncbi:YybH family protein [Sphingomonas flavalba]|uniref:YybH family protein n=1 Tax=Sphingomonas flavalba TaxID=2559804 RepID=UPI00109E27AF|nr:nuclear transport factor 2 family protein [Sphingomonas flavalba]
MARILTLPFLVSAVAIGGLQGSAGLAAPDPAPIAAALQPRLAAIENAWAKWDAPAVAAVYTDDAVATGEQNPAPAEGRAAMTALISHLMEGTRAVSIAIYRAEQLAPDVASTWVTWTVALADGQPDFQTKSLFVWKRVDGSWRIAQDMFALGPMVPQP